MCVALFADRVNHRHTSFVLATLLMEEGENIIEINLNIESIKIGEHILPNFRHSTSNIL